MTLWRTSRQGCTLVFSLGQTPIPSIKLNEYGIMAESEGWRWSMKDNVHWGEFNPNLMCVMTRCLLMNLTRFWVQQFWPSLQQTKPWSWSDQPHLTCAETVDKLNLTTKQQILQGPRHSKCSGILSPCFLPHVSSWTDASVMMDDCLPRGRRFTWQEIRDDTGNTSSSSTPGTARRSSSRRSRRVSTAQCSCHEMRGFHYLCTYWGFI